MKKRSHKEPEVIQPPKLQTESTSTGAESSDVYVIHWKSKSNGRAGRGEKRFSKDEAERLAEELNREYPEIEHEVIPAIHQS